MQNRSPYRRIFRNTLLATSLLVMPDLAIAQSAETAKPTTAEADDRLQDIIVTAQRRESSLQRTSASIATVSGEEIDRSGLKSLDEVAKDIPNVIISSSAIGFSATMRGVGTSPIPADIGGSSGVSTLYDGIYTLQEQAARTGFYDVGRFEVLRGPQGTLYGRNAEGGVFNVISNNPTQEFSGSATLEVGNYDLVRLTGMLNLPVTDTLAIRVAATHVDRNGYLSNGQDDNVATGARIKALFKPTPGIELLVAGEYSYSDGKGLGTVSSLTYPLPDPWTSTSPADQFTNNHSYRLWANLKIDVGIGDLTLIPAYQRSGPESHLQNTGAYNNIGSNPEKLVQRSFEARLTSKPGSPIDWIAGVYLYDYDQVAAGQDSTVSGGVIIPDPTQPFKTTTQSAKASGVFAQVTVPISDSLRVIGGARQSHDNYSIHTVFTTPFGPIDFYPLTKGKWNHFDWKAGVEFDVGSASMLYATASTGYRPGGFDPLPTGGFDLESLRSYEIGSKNEFFDHHLRLNAAAFYYDYQNYQVVTFVPGGPFGAQPMVLNAPKATIYGAEIDALWVVTPADTISVSGGYLHSEIKSPVMVSDPDGASPASLVSVLGATFANSPKWTAHAGYRHIFALPSGAEISVEPSVRYTSDYHITPAVRPTSNQQGYAKIDAQLSYVSANKAWSLNLYGRNLTNIAVKSAFLPSSYLLLQPPRTYGATLNVKF